MDLTLREAKLNPSTPLWIKVLPLAFVVVLAIGFISDRPWDTTCSASKQVGQAQCINDPPRSDVSTPTRPH